MQEYAKRVQAESIDLANRLKRLVSFIEGDTDAYNDLSGLEHERLDLQRYLMNKYNDVLRDRIEHFELIEATGSKS